MKLFNSSGNESCILLGTEGVLETPARLCRTPLGASRLDFYVFLVYLMKRATVEKIKIGVEQTIITGAENNLQQP